jgi:Flp pilus assembly protein TadD
MEFRQSRTRKVFATGGGKSVLLNLWSSWCLPCRQELAEFTERADDLRRAGIEVVALSVDALDEQNGDPDLARSIIDKLGFPFTARLARQTDVKMLEAYDSALTTHNRPLPIPTSFLIDPEGRVSVIYKGRVSVDQLLKDVGHSALSLEQRLLAAAPLKGRLIDAPAVQQTARTYEATVMYSHAQGQLRDDRLDDAVYHLRQAVSYLPGFAKAHADLGRALAGLGDLEHAQQSLETALSLDPGLVPARCQLATVHLQAGRLAPAVEALRRAVHDAPDVAFELTDLRQLMPQDGASEQQLNWVKNSMALHQRLAWVLATSTDEQTRDGPEATRWARRLVAFSQRRQPGPLWVLAAAHAETGRFDRAETLVGEAIELVSQLQIKPEKRDQLLARLREQLGRYVRGEPFREP